MLRFTIAGILVLGLLAACGQVITISLPGSPGNGRLPDGYGLLFSPQPHAFSFVETPDPVRRGQWSERFELREGDCGGSDCGNYRNRAEIAEDKDFTVARLNRDIWFGWSFYNDNIRSVSNDTWLGTVFGGWKLEGEQPSIFRFVQQPMGEGNWANCDPAFCNRGGNPTDDIVVQLDEIRQSANWGAAQNNGNICRLWGLEANLGRWVDIVVNTNFGTDGYGYLRIWINGEMKCSYTGQLVSAERARSQVPGPTNRRGIFNSYTQRWAERQGTAAKPLMIVHYDEFLVGLSRLDVDTRLREASRLPPVD
jgi:hypothetical protein